MQVSLSVSASESAEIGPSRWSSESTALRLALMGWDCGSAMDIF
jgi:hypothetical protein